VKHRWKYIAVAASLSSPVLLSALYEKVPSKAGQESISQFHVPTKEWHPWLVGNTTICNNRFFVTNPQYTQRQYWKLCLECNEDKSLLQTQPRVTDNQTIIAKRHPALPVSDCSANKPDVVDAIKLDPQQTIMHRTITAEPYSQQHTPALSYHLGQTFASVFWLFLHF